MANRYQQKQPIAKSLLRALPDTRANTRSVGPWVLVATILGSSMAFIDGTGRELWAVQFMDAQHGWVVGEKGTILRYAAASHG